MTRGVYIKTIADIPESYIIDGLSIRMHERKVYRLKRYLKYKGAM